MIERIIVHDKQDTLPSACPRCGGPVESRFAAKCAYCGSAITHVEVDTPAPAPIVEKPVESDPFAGCEHSETMDGSSGEISGGKYKTLEITGSSNKISDIIAEELIIGGSSNRISRCTVKKLILIGSSNRLGKEVKVHELLRVNGSSCSGEVQLKDGASRSGTGSSNTIKPVPFT